MFDRRVGMRYLGGWGGDFDNYEVSTTSLPPAEVLKEAVKKIRKKSLKDREKVFKKWKKHYDDIFKSLIPEDELQDVLAKDTYLSKLKNDLGLK